MGETEGAETIESEDRTIESAQYKQHKEKKMIDDKETESQGPMEV